MNAPDPTPSPESAAAWERRLHAELRQLPDREAPALLASNVMATIRARESLRARAWWRRPATMWPPALRVGFGVVALTALVAMAVGLHLVWPEVQSTGGAQALSVFAAKLGALWSAGHSVVDALGLAVQAVLTPVRLAIFGAIVLSQIILLGAGSAALRITLQPRRGA